MPPGGQPGDLFRGTAQNVDPQTPIGRLTRGMLGATAPPKTYLTAEEVRTAEEIQKEQTCRWCGGMHARACPRIKRLAFDPSGRNVVEVEFWHQSDWSDNHVVWPEDLVEKESDDGADAGS